MRVFVLPGGLGLGISRILQGRAVEIGLRAEGLALLEQHGYISMGRFAFGSSYCPGSGDDAKFLEEIVAPVWGETANAKKKFARRLFFEAYTLAAADMKGKIDRTDGDPPKKMPKIERESRIDAIKTANGSLKIKDHTEPGPTLVDRFSQMADDGILKYLPWSKSISTKWEEDHSRTVMDWTPNKLGQVVERRLNEVADQDVSKEVRALDQMFLRRGVAMAAADLLPLSIGETIRTFFTDAMDEDPPDLQRYERVSIALVAKADAELFRRVAKVARGGIKRRPDGTYPLEPLFERELNSHQVAQFLSWLAKPEPTRGSKRGGVEVSESESQKTIRRLEGQVAALKGQGSKGKVKGKGKGKQPWRSTGVPAMPKQMVDWGCVPHTPNREPYCFGFQLGNCTRVEAGQKCDKGWNKCAMPGCNKAEHCAKNHE